MKLGAFSISLNVKDLETSKTFYEALGFTVFGGNIDHKFLILKNGNAIIGLFQGMFEGNILTFNPKWDENSNQVEGEDVRDIQQQLQKKGISVDVPIDPQNASGPASITLKDPDGNVILIDQHV